MNKKILIVCALTATLLFTGCGKVATLKNGEEIVAQLNGKTITAEDLYTELKKQGGQVTLTNMIDDFIVNKEVKTDEDATSYADSQIESYKTSYESYGKDFKEALTQAGYKNEDEFKESLITEYKKKTLTEDYVKENISEKEINEYYKDKTFGNIEAKHILIAPEVTDGMSDEEKDKALEKAKKEAEDIIKKLDKGEKFEDLAKKYSDDEGTASDGGKLNVVYGSVVDEFWDGVSSLKDGKYTKEPVKSEYGYHIIYRVKQAEKPKLKDVKEEIIEKIVTEKMDEDTTLQAKALEALRKKYKLDISDSELKKSYEKAVKEATKNN